MSQIPPAGTENAPDLFDSTPGEAFVGLNLLELNVGQTDGPFTVTELTAGEFGKGSAKKTLPVYACLKGSTPVRMPIAASFLAKAKEAKLDVGDTFLIKRTNDYDSKDHGTKDCKSFLLKVISRAEVKPTPGEKAKISK